MKTKTPKPRYLIGIDPGTKTGVAFWDRQKKDFESIQTQSIISAMSDIIDMLNSGMTIELRIEDARQRTWFGKAGRERLKGVGSINRDCSIWEEFCIHHGLPFTMTHPKNSITKIKSEPFHRMTGFTSRTSEHGRDAAMLVFGL